MSRTTITVGSIVEIVDNLGSDFDSDNRVHWVAENGETILQVWQTEDGFQVLTSAAACIRPEASNSFLLSVERFND